jgi:hypothetical protein
VELFNAFDTYLEPVASRADLQLKFEEGQGEPVLPTRTLLAILRVTALILENCSNKHLYQSYEVNMPSLVL